MALVTLTLSQIFNANKALQDLTRQDLPIGVAFKLNRFIQKTTPELEQAEKQRVELLKKIGATEGENGMYSIPADRQIEFKEELEKLLSLTVSVEFEKIPLSTISGMNCKVIDVAGLSVIIDEDK